MLSTVFGALPPLCLTVIACLLGFSLLSQADLINIKVDDSEPDPITGQVISYTPNNACKLGQSCTDCTAKVDRNLALNQSWHDCTFNPGPAKAPNNKVPINQPFSAQFRFNGTAIYVYCILANSKPSPTASVDSNMTFYVDESIANTFVRDAPEATGHSYIYNALVFSTDSLPPGEHELRIRNGHENGKKSLLLLDYIVYSKQNNTGDVNVRSQDSRDDTAQVSAIIGGVLGGLGGLLVLGFGWLWYRRRQFHCHAEHLKHLTSEPTPQHRDQVVVPFDCWARASCPQTRHLGKSG